MAAVQPIMRKVYLAPTKGRHYLTARAAANAEAAAMVIKKYPTERDDPHCGGGWHWTGDPRLIAVQARLCARILRRLRATTTQKATP